MAAIDTKFVRGADRLKTRIATIQAAIALPDLTNEIGQTLLRRTLARFDREVTPDEVSWARLSEQTEITRLRKGYANKRKLVNKGTLRGAIRVIRGGLGTTFTNTGAGLRIGIDDPKIAEYGRVLNRGNGHIPARQFLGISKSDIKAVDSLMRRKALQLDSL